MNEETEHITAAMDDMCAEIDALRSERDELLRNYNGMKRERDQFALAVQLRIAERDAARARADKATELLREVDTAMQDYLAEARGGGHLRERMACVHAHENARAFLADIETETETT